MPYALCEVVPNVHRANLRALPEGNCRLGNTCGSHSQPACSSNRALVLSYTLARLSFQPWKQKQYSIK